MNNVVLSVIFFNMLLILILFFIFSDLQKVKQKLKIDLNIVSEKTMKIKN
jgi:hypothetical protein